MRILRSVNPTSEQLRILADAGPGFRLIRGAAGSGKTTTAILRLSQLRRARVNRHARMGLVGPIRILVLTFNRTLRGYIQALASEQSAPSDQIELTVDTFGRWARHLIGEPDVMNNATAFLREHLRKSRINVGNLEYFIGEIEYVLGRFAASQRHRYLDVVRSGRGRAPAVARPLRERLLNDVIAPYEDYKRRMYQIDWHDVALRAAEVANQRYDIVIVDESQDFSANQMRAITAHLDKDHSTTFIIDAAQRIYPQVFQWSELDIEIRPEMVYSLKLNHRNTVEIARLAASLVQDLPADPDGMVPDPGSCRVSGQKPQIIAGTYGKQVEYMLDQMKPSLTRGETSAILKPYGRGWFNYVKGVLENRGIPYRELTQNREWPSGSEQVALSTIHSAKGLEFDHVMMPGLSREVTPHGTEEGDGALDSLRRLVAMGIGRARKSVMLGFKPRERSTVFEYIDDDCYELIEL